MNKLWVRLGISFLLVTWGVVAIAALIVRGSVQDSFDDYVRESETARFGEGFVASLIDYYRENQSWDGVESLLPNRSGRGGQGGQGSQGRQLFIADTNQQVVASTNMMWMGRHRDSIEQNRSLPLTLDGEIIGYLGEQTPGSVNLNTAEAAFIDHTSQDLLRMAVVAGMASLLLGSVIAWGFTRPLTHLKEHVEQIRTHNIGDTLLPSGTEEVAALTQAFNSMSARLADAESKRQKMASDIAHELRTPVSVLRGHLEAMMDGVYPLDGEHVAIAYDQTLHLNHLVEDLRLLTRAEAGRVPLEKSPVPIGELCRQALVRFEPLATDAQVHLKHELAPDLPTLVIDRHRIQQVLDNLLTNALRHTPAGHSITLSATDAPDRVTLSICNTGSHLTDEQLASLFDRFWRADDARQRDSGGSGLGLAISRQMIHLHNGEIRATSDADSVTVSFWLPKVDSVS